MVAGGGRTGQLLRKVLVELVAEAVGADQRAGLGVTDVVQLVAIFLDGGG
jgi:hypothetical protein